MEPRTLVCLDPGLKSGCAVVYVSQSSLVLMESAENTVQETWEWLENTVNDSHSGITEVVCESFIITPETGKKTQSPWSLRLLGVAHYLSEKNGVPYVEQTPSQAKRLVTNQMIKDAGVWHRGGAGHANDAIRHGMYRAIQLGWKGDGVLPV